GNTVLLKEVKKLVERLSAVVGVSEAPVVQEVREEADSGNAVIQEYGSSGNTVIQKKAPRGKEGRKSHAPAASYRGGGQYKLNRRQIKALRAKRQRGAPIKALMEAYGLSKA